MKKDNKFRLYINAQNKRMWNIIEELRSNGLNVSSYFCSKIIEGYEKDNHHPMSVAEPEHIAPILKKNHLIHDLTILAKEHETIGIDGLNINYVLPHMFSNSEISKEDMTDLVVFIFKLYTTVICTNDIKNIIINNPDKILSSKKDLNSKYKSDEFKKILNLELLDDIDRKILFEEQKKKAAVEERNRKMIELTRKKLEMEKTQWEIENPGRAYWTKGMSDEEIETSNKLLSGEWEIVTDSYEPTEGE